MKSDMIKTEIDVKGSKIGIMRVGDVDYISLTDLAKRIDNDEPRLPIRDWMRNKEVISYLGLWEEIHNENFNRVEFDTFKNEAGSNSFKMSPQKWIKGVNSIGIISKSGKYNGGTYAHPDIAFEFASWLSPEFKLYLIKEFERLKKNEAYQNKIEWNINRELAKANYLIHTDTIKNYIVPTLTERQIRYVYAEEADVLNVALFGMTAKEWRDKNPVLAKEGNIRDYTDLLHLIILNNLENANAEFIKLGLKQSDRLVKLNESARYQMEILKNNKIVDNLKYLDINV
ncbi:MAG: KilA-N domain-containing protein [Bacilli bacterium]|nr:KilA-N domain-containing protein [Bacilli bacterium]